MKIAFDLDDTLISVGFPAENGSFWTKFLRREQLRQGTIRLFHQLRRDGHQIWIYTTSCRNVLYIKRLFWAYGFRLDGVINQDIHDQHAAGFSSKYPPAFGIDILVDDSPGVKAEGEKYGFRTIIVEPADDNWDNTILSKLNCLSG